MNKKEIRDVKAAQPPPKKPQVGVIIAILGTHVLANDVTLGQVTTREAVKMMEKTKA